MRKPQATRAIPSAGSTASPPVVPRGRRRLVAAAVLLGPLTVLFLLGDLANPVLHYARAPILAGEWWRLITGHLVHLDTAHLAVNAAVVLAWLYLFDERDSLRSVLARLLVYALLTGVGMLMLSPGLQWMLGASAITYAMIAGSAFRAALEGPRPLGLLLLACLAARMAAEQIWGLNSWFSHFVDYPIVSQAHGYGIAAGLLYEAWRLVARAARHKTGRLVRAGSIRECRSDTKC